MATITRFICKKSGLLLFLAVILLTLSPYAWRLGWPSLYMDDVVRVAFRQTETLGQSLFRPFNEHIAPLFEGVSWLTWQAAGRRLVNAPLVYTWASFIPFFLCLGLVGRLAQREIRDQAAAPVSMAVFGLSSLSSETVFWYSASSFTWALCCVLMAWLATLRALESSRRRSGICWLVCAALLSFASPCFCGLGLLAGPISAFRWWIGRRSGSWAGHLLLGVVPGLGTSLYLGMALMHRLGAVLTQSAERNLDLSQGLLCVIKAPVVVLLPGLVGLPNLDRSLSTALVLILAAGGLLGVGLWIWRVQRLRQVALVSLCLIIGGYGLTYPLRASSDPVWVLTVQRYHLFPQAGLALMVAAGLLPLSQLLRKRSKSLPMLGALALSALLLVTHASGIKRHARFFRYPEEGRTLAAIERLAKTAQGLGISRQECLSALDPIRNAWAPDPRLFNAFEMLPTWSQEQTSSGNARSRLLSALSLTDREALCGGMDASRHLIATSLDAPGAEPGRVVVTSQTRTLPEPGRFEARGELAFVEFDWPENSASPRSLLLNEPAEGEIWWTNTRGEWSPLRSLTWVFPDPGQSYRVSLDQVPHWQWEPDSQHRMRVLIRSKRPVAVGTPRLLR